jgi:hypothetical protein
LLEISGNIPVPGINSRFRSRFPKSYGNGNSRTPLFDHEVFPLKSKGVAGHLLKTGTSALEYFSYSLLSAISQHCLKFHLISTNYSATDWSS